MFSGSVLSNVVFGQENTAPARLQEAVFVSQSREFVERMPQNIYAKVAQGGANLSGGQRQRLSIARAVCKKPEIYIFDDSFSALDYKTDRELREALSRYSRDATKLIVAQRIGTIRHADQIIVLEGGRIVGKGTHRELMEDCQVYREIAFSQLS